MTTRRTLLSILGLSPTLPLAAADFADTVKSNREEDGQLHFGQGSAARAAIALRKLAIEIEQGRAYVQKLDMHSALQRDEFLAHTLVIEFVQRETV
jgi:hypothetical protein